MDEIRHATAADLPAMQGIFAEGRVLMLQRGFDQWRNGYPTDGILLEDIAKGEAWLLLQNGAPAAVAAFCFGAEPTYAKIYEGAWHTKEPYATLHRFAASNAARGKGAAAALYAHLERTAAAANMAAVRSDTHKENLAMQRFLRRRGFTPCGVVLMPDGTERVAFEKAL